MERWSVRWAWRFRVEQHDRDRETIKAVALNTSIQEMAERQASQAVVSGVRRQEPTDRTLVCPVGHGDTGLKSGIGIRKIINQVILNTSIQRMAERQAGQAAAAVQGMMLPPPGEGD